MQCHTGSSSQWTRWHHRHIHSKVKPPRGPKVAPRTAVRPERRTRTSIQQRSIWMWLPGASSGQDTSSVARVAWLESSEFLCSPCGVEVYLISKGAFEGWGEATSHSLLEKIMKSRQCVFKCEISWFKNSNCGLSVHNVKGGKTSRPTQEETIPDSRRMRRWHCPLQGRGSRVDP